MAALLIAVFAGAAVMTVLIVIALFEINDHMNRCVDDGSGEYIADERERERQCSSELR